MSDLVYADVIDIGSNSIRYMHAAVTTQYVTAVERKRLITTRLAQRLDDSGRLSEDAMRRSLDAIRSFVDISREKVTPNLFAYATSAVRDAHNGQEFCSRIQQETGVNVDVLSGDQEAKLAYTGAVGPSGGGLIDIGGGSAQVITDLVSYSFPIGCVRVKDKFSQLPYAKMRQELSLWLGDCCAELSSIRQTRWTGVGGTITTLAALKAGLTEYDPAMVTQQTISVESLGNLLTRLNDMGEARRLHPLLKDRHDVILCGGGVLTELMRIMDIQKLGVSDADGMEGYLLAKSHLLT